MLLNAACESNSSLYSHSFRNWAGVHPSWPGWSPLRMAQEWFPWTPGEHHSECLFLVSLIYTGDSTWEKCTCSYRAPTTALSVPAMSTAGTLWKPITEPVSMLVSGEQPLSPVANIYSCASCVNEASKVKLDVACAPSLACPKDMRIQITSRHGSNLSQ